MLGFSSFHRDSHMGSGSQNHAPGPGKRWVCWHHSRALFDLSPFTSSYKTGLQDFRVGKESVPVSSGQGLGYRNYSGFPEAGSVRCGGQPGQQMPGRKSPLH